MARPRSIPDATVYAAVLRLIAEQGEQAVAFSSVARATGLAGPTLAQRYGTLRGMLRAALSAWLDRIEAQLDAAETAAPPGAKGAQALLKALAAGDDLPDPGALLPAILRDADLRARLTNWRGRVEAALSSRLGGGEGDRESAAILFAAWQGQRLWRDAGARGFRLKDVVRALGSR